MLNNEELEQKTIFEWANLNTGKYPMLKYLNASLNGVRTTIKTAIRAKKTGMKKGYPDIFLPYPNKGYHGLFIELKRNKNTNLKISKGYLTPEQKEWLDYLNNNNYLAVVCYGSMEAIKQIQDYLK